MIRAIDLTGHTYGRLTVIHRADNDKHGLTRWVCRCECGNEVIVSSSHLRKGNTKSCGCLNKDIITKHGLWSSERDLYNLFRSMYNRCYNTKQENYERYGGRGVRICEEWLKDPRKFVIWAKANGFKKGLQIDRTDYKGNYSPDNCRFVTAVENCRNRCNTVKLGTWNSLSSVCEGIGIQPVVDGKTTSKYQRLRYFIKVHGSLSGSCEYLKMERGVL